MYVCVVRVHACMLGGVLSLSVGVGVTSAGVSHFAFDTSPRATTWR